MIMRVMSETMAMMATVAVAISACCSIILHFLIFNVYELTEFIELASALMIFRNSFHSINS